uniref:syndecan-2-like n=1 Tax=Myxine glutinosa TaxID=7769 RepID=UPI00358E8463
MDAEDGDDDSDGSSSGVEGFSTSVGLNNHGMMDPEMNGVPKGSGQMDDSLLVGMKEGIIRPEQKGVLNLPARSATSTPDSAKQGQQGFFGKTEVLAAVIIGGVVGILLAVLLIVLLVHRLKKKDAGSYALDQNKAFNGGYQKAPAQEIFA